ncbi:hypothetical protein K457DRAFT_12998 [Linnemannia elongata AG-77]|uniref:Uncharacterized protein n=1 Tax=Linnemannia elongata AG-77 TaxID=1314771 RepID=A0A197KF45_9FUNG|nr:hypothetical protein K457DRAFT_12998 [Linnemannia elongata AG-77]
MHTARLLQQASRGMKPPKDVVPLITFVSGGLAFEKKSLRLRKLDDHVVQTHQPYMPTVEVGLKLYPYNTPTTEAPTQANGRTYPDSIDSGILLARGGVGGAGGPVQLRASTSTERFVLGHGLEVLRPLLFEEMVLHDISCILRGHHVPVMGASWSELQD